MNLYLLFFCATLLFALEFHTITDTWANREVIYFGEFLKTMLSLGILIISVFLLG